MQLSGSATGRLLSKSLVRDPQSNFKGKNYLSYRQIGYYFRRIVRIPPAGPGAIGQPFSFTPSLSQRYIGGVTGKAILANGGIAGVTRKAILANGTLVA